MSQILRYFGGTSTIDTLTGNTGGPVSPTAGNINIVGTGDIVVTKTGPSTLTISSSGETIYTVQTTSATPTAIFTLSLAARSAVVITTYIIGAKADYSAGLSGSIIGGLRRAASGGTIIIEGPTVNYSEDSGTGNPVINLVLVGNSAVIQVTGETGVTYNWKASVSYQIVNV